MRGRRGHTGQGVARGGLGVVSDSDQHSHLPKVPEKEIGVVRRLGIVPCRHGGTSQAMMSRTEWSERSNHRGQLAADSILMGARG